MKVKDVRGNEIDFETAVIFMDSEIREDLHCKNFTMYGAGILQRLCKSA